MEYTKRRNLNRGYMKLEVWQRGMDLFEMAYRLAAAVADFKLRSQFTDSAQSVSANIAEGYGRRTLPEYLQFLYTAKGSLAETLTRGCGLRRVQLISGQFRVVRPTALRSRKQTARTHHLNRSQARHRRLAGLPAH